MEAIPNLLAYMAVSPSYIPEVTFEQMLVVKNVANVVLGGSTDEFLAANPQLSKEAITTGIKGPQQYCEQEYRERWSGLPR